MYQGGLPSEEFLQAVASASTDLPLSLKLRRFYDEARYLSNRFTDNVVVYDAYAGLVPVFHPLVAATGADVVKRCYNIGEGLTKGFEILCPLLPHFSHDDGDQIFVQGGLDGFQRNWDIFTDLTLSGMNWYFNLYSDSNRSNVLAAGGSVSACLQPLPDHVAAASTETEAAAAIRARFQQPDYVRYGLSSVLMSVSDVDLFLYGLENVDAARDKALEILRCIQRCSVGPVVCSRTCNTVTIVCRRPQRLQFRFLHSLILRHVQIVTLRLFKSPADVLASFDIDSCAVGYDGVNVYAAHRAFLSFVSRTNVVDRYYFSPNYKSRLYKYGARGFEILLYPWDRGLLELERLVSCLASNQLTIDWRSRNALCITSNHLPYAAGFVRALRQRLDDAACAFASTQHYTGYNPKPSERSRCGNVGT